MHVAPTGRPEIGQVGWLDEEIAEISLLMPGWQAAQLVILADHRHQTVGQLLRGLVRQYLAPRTGGTKESVRRARRPVSFERNRQ